MHTTARAVGPLESVYTCQASATRNIPSPTNEMLAPVPRRRKSRIRNGARSLTRPPITASVLSLRLRGCRLPAGESLVDHLPRRRLGEEEALRRVTAERHQPIELARPLDALS